MRVLGWLFVVALIFYGGYAAAMAVWSYQEMAGVIEEAVGGRPGREPPPRRELGAVIERGAAAAGIAVERRDIQVAQDGRTLRVRVKWRYAAVVVRGEPIFIIPLTIERAYPTRR
jgi:hypothetical protein